MFIATVLVFFIYVHAGKLGQVTDFTIMGGSTKHCVDLSMVLFRYCSLGGDTPGPTFGNEYGRSLPFLLLARSRIAGTRCIDVSKMMS